MDQQKITILALPAPAVRMHWMENQESIEIKRVFLTRYAAEHGLHQPRKFWWMTDIREPILTVTACREALWHWLSRGFIGYCWLVKDLSRFWPRLPDRWTVHKDVFAPASDDVRFVAVSMMDCGTVNEGDSDTALLLAR